MDWNNKIGLKLLRLMKVNGNELKLIEISWNNGNLLQFMKIYIGIGGFEFWRA